MELQHIKQLLSETLHIYNASVNEYASEEALLVWLTGYVEELASNDFDALLLLLYRIDVSEEKVREMLSEGDGQDSSKIIARLILERQKQKIFWRNKFKNQQTETDDEEKW